MYIEKVYMRMSLIDPEVSLEYTSPLSPHTMHYMAVWLRGQLTVCEQIFNN